MNETTLHESKPACIDSKLTEGFKRQLQILLAFTSRNQSYENAVGDGGEDR